MDSLYTTRASKNHAFCPHIFSILYSDCNFNGHVALHAHVNSFTPDLRYCSSTHINYNIVRYSRGPYRPKLTVKIKNSFFFFQFFLKFLFHSLFMYFFVYTPSNQHFKAFLVSKFNSETSFLYQLFILQGEFKFHSYRAMQGYL